MGRRTFLSGLAGAAASCSAEPAPPAPAPPPSTTSAAPPEPPDWAALRTRLRGGLVLPGEPGYDEARLSYNTLFDTRRPAAVASCIRPEDVQACVEVARTSRIPIAARSGGHSYAGYSTPDSALVADVAGLTGVRVTPDGTAEIGAGAKLIDVYAELARAGRCLPAGTCPTVGIAGLTLSGGIGVLARKFGLTCDRLLSARIVTADGMVRTASAESEPDLFWALRGGGGGNFGIVTSLTFSTEPAPDLTVFAIRFPAGAAADVLGAWQTWMLDAPDELWTICGITAGKPPPARIVGCYLGGPDALNPLLAKLPVRPSSRLVEPMGYLDAMRYFAGCTNETIAECHPESAGGDLERHGYVASSRMLPDPVDPTSVVNLMAGHTGVDLMLDSWRGAISRIAPDATALPHRTALASAQIYASATPTTRDRLTQSVTEIRDALTPLTGPTGYIGYIDPTMPNWPTAYYGPNLPRLRDIAHHYDPDALFTFPQSITTA